MTKDERDKFDEFTILMRNIIRTNEEFRNETKKEIEALKVKVETKHIPITLEQQILNSTTISLSESIKKVLVDDYNSPLKKLINEVVLSYEVGIKQTLSKLLKQSIENEELYEELKIAFIKKVSREIIDGIDSSVSKTVSQLKNEPVFKSELLLVINNLVSNYNKK